jgi:hypothetical protein
MRRATILAAVVGAVLVVASCGGDDSDADNSLPSLPGSAESGGADNTAGTDSGSPTSSDDPLQVALAFAQCMRDNGVPDFPDPVARDDGSIFMTGPPSDDPDLQPAQETCQSEVPAAAAVDAPDEEEVARTQDRMLEFAACMRDHGFDFPDPDFGDDGTFQATPGAGVDFNDPEFKDAADACGGQPGFDGPPGGQP